MNDIRRCINLIESYESQKPLDEGVMDTLEKIYNKFKSKIVGTKSSSATPKFTYEFREFLSRYTYEGLNYNYEHLVSSNEIDDFKKNANAFGLKAIDDHSNVFTMPIYFVKDNSADPEAMEQYVTVVLSTEPDDNGNFPLLLKITDAKPVGDDELSSKIKTVHDEKVLQSRKKAKKALSRRR